MWGIELKRHSEIPLARQIYMTLREQMLAGFLQAGEMLPSTREMATDLSVSRNTVCEAYEMLAAEGYIISHQGSPTRVADGLQLKRPVPAFQKLNESFQAIGQPTADFWTGQPDLRRFPMRLWLQLVRISAAELPITQWGYTGPDGLPALREQIATWLFRSKGLEVSPQDIFITAGSTHALHIIAEILSSEGKEIIVEDPCHMGMIQVLQKTGFIIRPVPVDGHGIQTEHIESQGACAVYLTPSHQFPLGGILPAGRRADLIRMARNNNLYLIEDDYDSEFRYAGPPITPLFSMDPQRVIYV
ncbi:MAG TPA: PLP-dependent aminotransferase family protein, partial [Firmicutes bacterium]|nr:PLP-dependent aminotransferase family protein [Bacillota bacterium]